jgi:hypothetical protein
MLVKAAATAFGFAGSVFGLAESPPKSAASIKKPSMSVFLRISGSSSVEVCDPNEVPNCKKLI